MSSPLSPTSKISTSSLSSSTSSSSSSREEVVESQVPDTPSQQPPPQEETPSSSSSSSSSSSTPHFSFGVVADIQYANIPDGFSFGGAKRYYRHSLEVAKEAAAHFQREGVSCVLNLGDTVDGKQQELGKYGGDELPAPMDPGHVAMKEVMAALSSYTHGPYLHTYGNHCLYNLDRHDIQNTLGIPFVQEPCGDLVAYRSYVHQKIRFVVLDTYDIALMKRCETSSRKRKIASEILSKNNHNYPHNENSPEGLEGIQKRFVAFNGGVDKPQLTWLQQTLEEARTKHEKVVVMSHQPIMPESSGEVCLIWNYQDVLDILREYGDIVIASLAGHAHRGGYKRDEQSGIHFRVIEAVLENPHPHSTYAIVDVLDDRLVLHGYGNCQSAVYDFSHLGGSNEQGSLQTRVPESISS
eukprot:CAMPEP_0195287298 /NCGR_PEP_ID=MMETSP0707-20130614/4415_1 /TAXON_ID=33640 /ORGANISM="Asterionellopsis glacialis, Strain CCMP134" /LENGTH=410 /DNA_ID=CAMNT_0040347045 /DNA_START=184 /DNA_END=1416 /DNA_ORIENTATION=-